MKRYIYIISCLLGLSFLAACEKDMKDYEGTEGLYFDVQYTKTPWFTNEKVWAHQLYSVVKFKDMPGVTETDLKLKVAVVGPIKDYDRPFEVMVVQDSTTAIEGTEYSNLSQQCVVKAGETVGYVTLKVHKTPRMETENVQLQLGLVPNEHFTLPYKALVEIPGRKIDTFTEYSNNDDPRIHNIFITDIWKKQRNFIEVQFGRFSKEKMELFLELYPEASYNDYEDDTKMPLARRHVIATVVRKYLMEQYEKGTPVCHEDGTPMWVEKCPWDKDYEDIPYM